MRYAIVAGLEKSCDAFDALTGSRFPHRLAALSYRIDQRWHTGYWRAIDESDMP